MPDQPAGTTHTPSTTSAPTENRNGLGVDPSLPAPPNTELTVTPASTRPTRSDVLLSTLAETVLAVPGVVRLEPTLSTSGPGLLTNPRPTDGVRLLARAGVADVDVNIATATAYTARDITHTLQARVAELLLLHGYQPGAVTVSVLTIEPASAA